MDFFKQQDASRRRTVWLVVLFTMGLVGVTLCVVLLVLVLTGFAEKEPAIALGDILIPVAAVTSGLILLASLIKLWQLRRGGIVVAQQLDARLLVPDRLDFHSRRLLNVVEEMALASGVPVPPVFVLDNEESINAFAAGYRPNDAVIGVTRGFLTRLNREEQQGVIAHEFSHILNGDMRFNLRLLAFVHGLLFLATVGHLLFRVAARGRGRDGKGRTMLLLAGAGLYLIGMAGSFFGKLMQSAVSRQREFLADASAVQFTRNPSGLAGALKKIAALGRGSSLQHPGASEMGHMFFAFRRRSGFSPFATHPPLLDRILRLEPSFDGTMPTSVPVLEAEPAIVLDPAPAMALDAQPPISFDAEPLMDLEAEPLPEGAASFAAPANRLRLREPQRLQQVAARPERIAEEVGDPLEAHLRRIREILTGLPESIRQCLQAPADACCVVLGLLLSRDAFVRGIQSGILNRQAPPGWAVLVSRLRHDVAALPPAARLPLVDLALPALRQLSPAQHERFLTLLQELTDADREVSLFEYALQHVLRRHLRMHAKAENAESPRIHRMLDVLPEISTVLSVLARGGSEDSHAQAAAFAKGTGLFGDHGDRLVFGVAERCTMDDLHDALETLAGASFRIRGEVLKASSAVIAHDRRLTVTEAELLRLLADALECPLPVWISAPENKKAAGANATSRRAT